VPGRSTLVKQDATPAVAHQLPPAGPNEAPEVANARQLLTTINDPNRQLLVIRRVLEQASISPHKTAEGLLRLLLPFGQDYPAVATVLRQRLAELQIEKPGTGTGTRIFLDERGAADAAAFNAKQASNATSFGTATGVDPTDVQAIAAWQKAHGLDPDGKLG
jgi:murein L,D-transpeptidase YcbB/YkuD